MCRGSVHTARRDSILSYHGAKAESAQRHLSRTSPCAPAWLALPGLQPVASLAERIPSPYRRGDRATVASGSLAPSDKRQRERFLLASTTPEIEREGEGGTPELRRRSTRQPPAAMCKLKFTKERVGCYLLVILVIVLIIGVLFGLGVFRHGYDRIKDLGRNHTCYDCNRS